SLYKSGFVQPALYALTTTSAPVKSFVMASFKTSFSTNSIDLFSILSAFLTIVLTECPRSTNSFTILEPTNPVPPITITLIIIYLQFDKNFLMFVRLNNQKPVGLCFDTVYLISHLSVCQ